MQNNKLSSNISKDTDWQVLGELELPVGSPVDAAIATGLTEILAPLELQADFVRKVLHSAQEAAARASLAGIAEPIAHHIHLILFVSREQPFKPQTWGFFRIEKIERATTDSRFPDHAIEFYLYLDENQILNPSDPGPSD